MSKIKGNHVFTSESVSEGHPDKVSDQVSDAILDACLEHDPTSRVACETLVTTNLIVVAGEITTSSPVDYAAVARRTVREIWYCRSLTFAFQLSQDCQNLPLVPADTH